jgi:hypothetical protein
MVCFQLGERDEAVYLERHLNTPNLAADDIRSLPQYQIYAQLVQKGVKLPAFWARTPSPPSTTYRGQDDINLLIQRGRESYAQPREVVEQEIASRERRKGHDEPEKRLRQEALAAYAKGSGNHPGGGAAWSHDPGAGSKVVFPEER